MDRRSLESSLMTCAAVPVNAQVKSSQGCLHQWHHRWPGWKSTRSHSGYAQERLFREKGPDVAPWFCMTRLLFTLCWVLTKGFLGSRNQMCVGCFFISSAQNTLSLCFLMHYFSLWISVSMPLLLIRLLLLLCNWLLAVVNTMFYWFCKDFTTQWNLNKTRRRKRRNFTQ